MTSDQIAKDNAELWNKFALGAGRSISKVSLAPGFSRVVGVVNDGNGFNRFPRVTTTKPLKRLGCHPRLFTGLKPGANERPHEIASARIAEAKEFVN